jgi:phospholipid/cholesterol/gamma-HCH transport system substrate-binding protein
VKTPGSVLRRRYPRAGLLAVLLALFVGGLMVGTPEQRPLTITGYFSSAIGLYPGDRVEILGVPVGKVESIRPGRENTKITFTVRDGIAVPADAAVIIVAPNLVSARTIELAPMYSGGPKLEDNATIGEDRTAVPVEWDDVKEELTELSAQLGPHEGSVQGPLSQAVDQAATTFDGQGRRFRQAVRELSQTAGRLGDASADLAGTVKNLHALVEALSRSNEQIVQFSTHVASLSQVFADSSTDLASALDTLNSALTDVRSFLNDNNTRITGQVQKLADFTTLLTEHSTDIEQVLHVAPNGLANFYNIYNPAQGSIGAILSLPNFGNPIQFLCAGVYDAGATPEYYNRTEICRQRMAPVLKRLMMNFPPLLFHPITSITGYKGQMIYDAPATQAKAQTPVSQLQWQPLPGVTPANIPPGSDLSALLLPSASPPAAPESGLGAPSTGAPPDPPARGPGR